MTMEIEEVMQYLPHRYPFLLIDRIVEMELGKSVTAIKNVTINEPFFPGHFQIGRASCRERVFRAV